MTNKIRLKEMSHKKLRKFAKGLAKQCQEYSKENGMLLNSEAKKAGEIGDLKRYATSLEKTLASEARRIKEKNEKLEEKNKRIEDLQQSNTSLLVKQRELRDKITDLEHALDALGNGVTMGVDGQLRSFNEMTDVEFATFVAEDVRRAMVEDEPDKVEDAEVTWAIRNGHHQPEGTPEPNRMENVRIKTADEISAENKQKHVDIVCNEIQKDASRILNAIDYIDSGHTDKM